MLSIHPDPGLAGEAPFCASHRAALSDAASPTLSEDPAQKGGLLAEHGALDHLSPTPGGLLRCSLAVAPRGAECGRAIFQLPHSLTGGLGGDIAGH